MDGWCLISRESRNRAIMSQKGDVFDGGNMGKPRSGVEWFCFMEKPMELGSLSLVDGSHEELAKATRLMIPDSLG